MVTEYYYYNTVLPGILEGGHGGGYGGGWREVRLLNTYNYNIYSILPRG